MLTQDPEWSGVLRFNTFAVRVETGRMTPWRKAAGEQWTDNDDRRTAEWLQRKGLYVNTNLAGEAVQTIALENSFHPLRDYLRGLKWDGVPRLGQWVKRYLGAEKEIECTFGCLWVRSAVARALKPGSKADCALMLEGPQGKRKSSALRTLAEPWEGCGWFTDQIADFRNKDANMQCHGVWIVEMAELDSLSHAENSRIKAFMSQQFDRFRLPYGKNLVYWPRDCVFAGTVNQDQYLRDETGARRFWPVRCGEIDLPSLAADRDQLLAEAVNDVDSGAVWWLQDQKSIEEAEAEQQDRYTPGPWDGLIAAWLDRYTPESVSTEEILLNCIGKVPGQWGRADQMVVGAALRHLGWVRGPREWVGETKSYRYRKTAK
jgi:predicted P-loop ATPase